LAGSSKRSPTGKKDWASLLLCSALQRKDRLVAPDDGDKIEPFADQADEEIRKAQSFLDTATPEKAIIGGPTVS